MSSLESLSAALGDLGEKLVSVKTDRGEVTAIVRATDLLVIATTLRDAAQLRFEQLSHG
jgi:hypothetical protein